VTVAVDVMGGDHAPHAILQGIVEYLEQEPNPAFLLLVGQPEVMTTALANVNPALYEIVAAPTVVEMDDHPVKALMKKPDASIPTCAKLVATGRAGGTFSAGNTGACMVAAIQIMERVPGVARPALGSFMPTITGPCLFIDAGANVDNRPSHLVDFAIMGSVYTNKVQNLEKPRVALLSNGEEDSKGDQLTKEARELLKQAPVYFSGNIEGNAVFEHEADVVVCDGFAGNLFLKGVEGMGNLGIAHLKKCIAAETNPVAKKSLEDALHGLMLQVDYAEYGGAPLLGVNGVSVIGHGRSNPRAVVVGIQVTARAAASGYVKAMQEIFATLEPNTEK
jgi:phosphate acyltransferase